MTALSKLVVVETIPRGSARQKLKNMKMLLMRLVTNHVANTSSAYVFVPRDRCGPATLCSAPTGRWVTWLQFMDPTLSKFGKCEFKIYGMVAPDVVCKFGFAENF